MWNYASGEAMLRDALRLSQGMSYKNAIADLELGGGKGVIWGDARKDKTPAMFRAFGRAVESLNGQYYTAEDVGISTADMAIVAEETRFVAGLESGKAASGDPSPVTAKGVYRGILECTKRAFGSGNVDGMTVAVQGVGHVGANVVRKLVAAGANVIIADVNEDAVKELAAATGAKVVEPDAIYDVGADVFSPNALGAIINEETLARLKVKVVAGGANNQLATPAMAEKIGAAGILYAPDYVINGGGIINVASEISGEYSREWVDGKLDTLMATLGEILDRSLEEKRPTAHIADAIARERIAAARNR